MENKNFPLIRKLNLHVIPHNIKIMKLLKYLLMRWKDNIIFSHIMVLLSIYNIKKEIDKFDYGGIQIKI